MNTEEILLIFELYEKGVYVFGGKKKIVKWLTTPTVYYNGKKPIDLPINEILDELNRIEHGIL